MRHNRPADFGSKMRTGFADGGSADDNQYASQNPNAGVQSGTAAKWDPAAYQAAMEQQQESGYAQGGVVRQNFDGGGSADLGAWATQAQIARAKQQDAKYKAAKAASGDLQITSVKAGGQTVDPGPSQYLAEGGEVRRNFRGGGTVFKDDEEARKRMEAANRQQGQVDAAEQQRYDALSDHEKRIYQLNSGEGIDNQGTTFRGTNDAMSSVGSNPGDSGSVSALASTIGASAGYAQGGMVRRRTGYADGGVIRRNFDDGGVVDDSSQGTSDYEQQRRIQETARQQQELAAQRQADIEQQAGGNQQTRLQPQTETARQDELGAQATDTRQAQIQSDNTAQAQPATQTPWYKQVYDRLADTFKEGGRLNQPNDAAGDMQRINPYARTQADDLWDQTAETAKGSWVNRMLGGEKSYSPDELNQIQAKDPGRDIQGHLQKLWGESELKGDHETAGRVLQTVRNGMNTANTVANVEFNRGNWQGATQAIEHSLNMLPDNYKYNVNPTTDGRIQVQMTPEKPGMGEPRTVLLSPAQARDFLNSNASQPDHLIHNGVAGTLDMLTGKNKPLDVPDEGMRGFRGDGVSNAGGQYREPKDNVAYTQGGFHPDSPMGLMDRDTQSRNRGRPDPEANAYADRARDAVSRGVPPDQVHQFLREGKDQQQGAPEGPVPPAAAAVTRGADGRPVYSQQSDIPGANAPAAPTPELRTGMLRYDAPAERYISAQKDASSTSKGGSSAK